MIKNKSDPLTLFCCVLLLTEASALVNNTYISRERDALAFKAGLVDSKNRLTSLKWEDHCQWSGITCNSTTAHVVRLDLRNTYTYSQFEVEAGSTWFVDMSYALCGEIHSSILLLQHLSYLDLSYNNFSSAKIPEFIGSLKELVYLNLTGTEFGGRIPPHIRNLSNLQYLDLSFSNNLYSDDVTWLTHFSSLRYLDLSSVDLGSVTNWKILGTLPRLKTVYLSECQLNDTNFALSHVNFTELVILDLCYNRFSNPHSLNWVWNLTGLNYVDFSMNEFDGRLINELGSINSIEILYLGWNNLMNMKASNLKNLTNLKDLELSGTQITGDITEFMGNLSLHGLQSLYRSHNILNGNLSSWIGHMTSLSFLYLSYNNLSGSIPLSIRKLSQLVELDLLYNNFHGTITENHLSNMTSLEYLLLYGNPLNIVIDTNWIPSFRLRVLDLSSCNLGSKFPRWLKWQTYIRYLDISNTSIADEVPEWFWHVFSNSNHLDLSRNNLSGWMPESLEFMSINFFYLNNNELQGSVPKLPKTLHELDLSRNVLSGSLQLNMKHISLKTLALAGNRLIGSIPQSLCQLQQQQFLDLSRNFLVGNFPNCWRNNQDANKKNYLNQESKNERLVKQRDLKVLILSYNNLSGKFPEYVNYYSNLVFMNLESNNLFGSIPPWIGEKLPSLEFLLLAFNKFSGPLPSQLFKLKQLKVVDISHNNLNGTIPRSLKTLKAMTITNVSDLIEPLIAIEITPYTYWIMFTVIEIYTKGQVLDLEKNIHDFRSLDLSCNNLVGYIPEEIGALVGLMNLNLSGNKLSENIPTSIGYLQSLESLNLSTNRLSGSIPLSLSYLTFLSHLNLSYNNLSGRIPSGHQLQTLDDPSIYEGNSGLCGFSLPIECFKNRTTSQPFASEKEDGYEIYVGASVGFTTGVWIVYVALALNKACKFVYFVLVDKMYDKLYVFLILCWARIA